MSGSPELRTIKKCTPELKTTLSGLERDLLVQEGKVSGRVNPQFMLTEKQRAGLLVEKTVKQDPSSYHTSLKDGDNLYRWTFEKEYSELMVKRGGRGITQSHAERGEHHCMTETKLGASMHV